MIALLAEGGGGAIRLLVTQLLGFTILASIIGFFAWKHIVNIFTARRERIRSKVEEADKGAVDTKAEIGKVEAQLSGVDQTQKARLAKADKEARAGRDDLMIQAKQSADGIKDRAVREVTLERDKALLILREDSIRLTLQAAESLVDRTMDDATHQALVDKYIQDLGKAAQE